MIDHPAELPEFTIDGATFRCWVADDGVNELGLPAIRFEWRSAAGRCVVGRRGRDCWARTDGRVIGAHFASIKLAMIAAVRAARREAAA